MNREISLFVKELTIDLIVLMIVGLLSIVLVVAAMVVVKG